MNKNVVDWFEIPVKDMARAKKFYGAVFGKELMDMNMPGMEMAAFPWINEAEFAPGSLVKSEGYEPSSTGTVVYFTVTIQALNWLRFVKAGGKS